MIKFHLDYSPMWGCNILKIINTEKNNSSLGFKLHADSYALNEEQASSLLDFLSPERKPLKIRELQNTGVYLRPERFAVCFSDTEARRTPRKKRLLLIARGMI